MRICDLKKETALLYNEIKLTVSDLKTKSELVSYLDSVGRIPSPCGSTEYKAIQVEAKRLYFGGYLKVSKWETYKTHPVLCRKIRDLITKVALDKLV